MHIKNYTSTVPVSRTISRIEQFLASIGVSSILKEYNTDGTIGALIFSMLSPNGNGTQIKIRLPANVEAVGKTMAKEIKRYHRGTRERLEQQAERTAWKLMQDWIEVQSSLVKMNQVEAMEVFLPFVYFEERRTTLYNVLKRQEFKLLGN